MNARTSPTTRVLDMLDRGVPLTLLVDLVDPRGPRSHEIYSDERTAHPGALIDLATAR